MSEWVKEEINYPTWKSKKKNVRVDIWSNLKELYVRNHQLWILVKSSLGARMFDIHINLSYISVI